MSARAKLVTAIAAVVVLVAAGITVWLVAPWKADESAQPPVTNPFSVTGRGATVPFVEYEAEAGATNAALIGPDRTAKTLASEASGRRAVTLDAGGEYVEFTLTKPANAINVRLSIPDSSDGVGNDATLSLYVNGTDTTDLAVTSKYSWFYGGFPFGNGPAAGMAQHFYDESRLLFDRTLPAGTKVRLQKDPKDIAASYTVDLADFEQVPAPIAQPAGALSVVEFGADPTGAKDSGAAFARGIASARAQGKELYIPQGRFQVNQHLIVDQVTLRGAGMWYSVLTGDGVGVYGKPAPDTAVGGGSKGVYLTDFAIFGEVTERIDENQVNGIGGALGGGSVVANLWIQHTKVGIWLDGPFDGLTITGNRIISATADGLNLHRGVSHTVVENNVVRNTGDDGLASWSDQYPNHDNVFRYNTVVAPLLANGIAIYGGENNAVTDNVVADTQIEGAGIQLANRHSGTTFIAGDLNVERNTLLRTGSTFNSVLTQVGAIWMYTRDAAITGHVVLKDNDLLDSTFSGLVLSGDLISDLEVDGLLVESPGTYGIQFQSGGSGTFAHISIRNPGRGPVFYCDALPFTIGGDTTGLTESRHCGEFGDPVYHFDGTLPGRSAGVGPAAGPAAVPSPPARTPSGEVEGPAGNLAQGATMTASTSLSGYPASAVVDGDPDSYWESVSRAFPQSITADLGGASKIKKIVLRLPPSEAWLARHLTIGVSTSLDGSAFTEVLGAKKYLFDPATGNTATIVVPATNARYVKLTITANTGWESGQLSEIAVFA